jgi:hypothetical protein
VPSPSIGPLQGETRVRGVRRCAGSPRTMVAATASPRLACEVQVALRDSADGSTRSASNVAGPSATERVRGRADPVARVLDVIDRRSRGDHTGILDLKRRSTAQTARTAHFGGPDLSGPDLGDGRCRAPSPTRWPPASADSLRGRSPRTTARHPPIPPIFRAVWPSHNGRNGSQPLQHFAVARSHAAD